MILAMFALVPLPSAGKTILSVFNATATGTIHGELLKKRNICIQKLYKFSNAVFLSE